jgi:hypothetical protein
MICPGCNKTFRLNGDIGDLSDEEQIAYTEGSTLDCPHCQLLCIATGGKLLDFHKWMHEGDARWPKDGDGAGYATIY